MGDMVKFIDIIIFAVIAILLVLRLRSVLGQRNGFEQPQNEHRVNEFNHTENDNDPIVLHPQSDDDKSVAVCGLDALRKIDHRFDETEFLTGAKAAFEMILTAYAEGDITQLKRLLGYELLESFTNSIQDRAKAHESLSIQVEKILEISILNISVINQIASISVHFHSKQIRIAKDQNDNPIDPEDLGLGEFTDIWTFERDLTLSDPNWKLVETESADEDD